MTARSSSAVPNVMAGYWRGEPLADGWFATGDVGRLDDDGYLTIVDRIKDLILRGGFNVYPRDVEDALMTHPAVAMAAVVGRPDERRGEEVVAFVSLVDGTSVDAGRADRVRPGAARRPQVPARGAHRRRDPVDVGRASSTASACARPPTMDRFERALRIYRHPAYAQMLMIVLWIGAVALPAMLLFAAAVESSSVADGQPRPPGVHPLEVVAASIALVYPAIGVIVATMARRRGNAVAFAVVLVAAAIVVFLWSIV